MLNGKFTSLVFGLIYFLLLGCASSPQPTELDSVFKRIPNSEYQRLLKDGTRNDKKYSGFYNKYQVSVTRHDSETAEALLQRMGFYMQWNVDQGQQNRTKTVKQLSEKSRFFVSLFTPKTANNDLHKGRTMWKIYLDVDGQRFVGKAKKVNLNLDQLKTLYPLHSRFDKAYYVDFDVPMTAVEKSKAVFTLTSSLGTSQFTF